MRLADYRCPTCQRIEPDVVIPRDRALDVDCLPCGVRMVRQIAPIGFIWNTTGRGGQA